MPVNRDEDEKERVFGFSGSVTSHLRYRLTWVLAKRIYTSLINCRPTHRKMLLKNRNWHRVGNYSASHVSLSKQSKSRDREVGRDIRNSNLSETQNRKPDTCESFP